MVLFAMRKFRFGNLILFFAIAQSKIHFSQQKRRNLIKKYEYLEMKTFNFIHSDSKMHKMKNDFRYYIREWKGFNVRVMHIEVYKDKIKEFLIIDEFYKYVK